MELESSWKAEEKTYQGSSGSVSINITDFLW